LVTVAQLSLLPTGTFAVDPSTSRVEFFISDTLGGFTGVAPVEGTAVVRELEDTFTAEVVMRFDARLITTGMALRDQQMHRDFLETERFPFITFTGTARLVDQPRAGPFRVMLTGQLTIRDQTRDVQIPLRVIALRDVYLAEGQATIRLSDFNIPTPRFLFLVADDPVAIKVKVRFVAR